VTVASGGGPAHPPAVVVAEDSLVVRAVLVEQLLSRGYRVIEAGDGEQALAACHRERPDVVLLDVEVPHLDGHAVLARIKADSRLADIPVVFVTSRVTTDDVVEGLRLGAHDTCASRSSRASCWSASTRPCAARPSRTSCGCATPSSSRPAGPTPSPG
jgi:CheY-like chemotaxis protein